MPGPTTEAAKHNAAIKARHEAIVAKRNAQLAKWQATSAERWIQRVKELRTQNPGYLEYLRKTYPKQVAEAERAIAASTAASTPKVAPKVPAVRPRLGSPKLRAGLKFGAGIIASLIPDIILAVADRAAAKEALRTIAIKFVKEGFAKGVAAGVMRWTEEEVQLNLKYRVTNFRVQHLHDPAGLLTRSQILQVAESCENYAVDVGFEYSARQSPDWKRAMLEKGLSILAKRNVTKYRRTTDPAVLFEFEFINDLAWVLRPTTDSIVEPALRIS
jgi:hypothetical protein